MVKIQKDVLLAIVFGIALAATVMALIEVIKLSAFLTVMLALMIYVVMDEYLDVRRRKRNRKQVKPVVSHQSKREEYEAFFQQQPYFKQLKFIHGDRLFDFDEGIGYRNLTVQVWYVSYCKRDGEFVL